MKDTSNIIQRHATKAVNSESIDEKVARSIGDTIAGDPRLIRSQPNSPEELSNVVNIVDEAAERIGLGAFGVSEPDQMREKIVKNVDSHLRSEYKSLLESHEDGSLPSASKRQTAIKETTINHNLGGVSMPGLATGTGSGKSHLFIVFNRLTRLLDKIAREIDVRFNSLVQKRLTPRLRNFLVSSLGDSHQIAFTNSKTCDDLAKEYYNIIEKYDDSIEESLVNFQRHRNSYLNNLQQAKKLDDLEGSNAFRKAVSERLKAEKAAVRIATHQQEQALLYLIFFEIKHGDQDRTPFLEYDIDSSNQKIWYTLYYEFLEHPPEQKWDWNAHLERGPRQEYDHFHWQELDDTLEMVWDSIDNPLRGLDEDNFYLRSLPSNNDSEFDDL